MAVEGTKIKEMMEGKTLEKDNIKKMYDMVQNASEPEEKKKVMKHSVFFIGQLPLKENHIVDLEQTRRIVNSPAAYNKFRFTVFFLTNRNPVSVIFPFKKAFF